MTLARTDSLKTAVLLLGLLLLPSLAHAAGKTEIRAKPGGKIRITHGTPAWNEKFLAQMQQLPVNWRLGSGGATTITTDAALLFDDAVIFPGEYNLALTCEDEGEWALVFHHDGDFYENARNSGKTMLRQGGLGDKEKESKMLVIELAKQEEAELPYLLSIHFGPFKVAKPFATAKARTITGKAGKHRLTSTYLERTDLEELKKTALADEVCVAIIESPSFKGKLKLFLRTGEEVSMVALRDDEVGVPRYLDGQSGKTEKPTKMVTHKIKQGNNEATLIFTIGDETFHFAMPVALIDRLAETDDF